MTRNRLSRTIRPILGILALAGLGCGSPEPAPTVYFDFVEELPVARQNIPRAAGVDGDASRARAEGQTLVIPPGVRLHYALEMPPAARIVFAGVRPQGAEGGTLRISATPHAGETRLLAKLAGQRGRTEIEWRAESTRIVRLNLLAGEHGGAIAVRSPAIWVDRDQETAAATPALDRREIRRLRRVDRPNVLIYLIDSLRADRLGAYGYDKEVSPAIDAFAESALVFDNATANSSWTKSAVASIFTGLWPASHQTITREDKLPDAAFTLAEALRDEGYVTVGFSTNPSIAGEFGFAQGFDRLTLLHRDTYAEEVTRQAAAWLHDFDGKRPFLLYVHTLDPHDPYVPPPEQFARWSPDVPTDFAARSNKVVNRLNQRATRRHEAGETLASLEALYDGEIASNDRGFAGLLRLLEESGELRDTVVVLVADHGEDFGEHGAWRHGNLLSRKGLHVPLMVRLPGQHRPGREPGLVQQIDILPTLLELLEIDAPQPIEGESLLPLFLGRPAADRPAFAYVRFSPPTRFGVLWRGWKLVSRADGEGRGPSRLFHLKSDPAEQRNVALHFPVMREFLQTMLARRLLGREHALTGEKTEISSETEKALRALGYIH